MKESRDREVLNTYADYPRLILRLVAKLRDKMYLLMYHANTLRPRQNGRHFPDDIFKWIFVNENAWISINISLKFVPMGLINNIPVWVEIMAWRRPGDKPLSEPMLVSLLTHMHSDCYMSCCGVTIPNLRYPCVTTTRVIITDHDCNDKKKTSYEPWRK